MVTLLKHHRYYLAPVVNIRFIGFATLTSIVMTLLHHFFNQALLDGTLGVISKYVFADFKFLWYLIVLMGLDLVSGVYKGMRKGNLVLSRGLRDTVDKCIQYFIFLIVAHNISNVEIMGKSFSMLHWFSHVACSYLILIEAKSILENIQEINPRLNLSYFIKAIDKVTKFVTSKNNTKLK